MGLVGSLLMLLVTGFLLGIGFRYSAKFVRGS